MRVLLAAVGTVLLVAGCGTQQSPDTPSSTSSGATVISSPADSSPASSTSSEPPLSNVPPPTLQPPTAPPLGPSDQIKPLTLTGSAARQANGCILLSTPTVKVELVGALAADALAHAKVSVVVMPKPTATSSCDVAVVSVQSVTPVN